MLKNILCFGDSNTYGFIAGTGGRYSENIRWTRRLRIYFISKINKQTV
ncbi:MAG TPA: hypothetical protein VJ888_08010 [Mobilitalea sp.]|nr:hypothetical protein [Mobilitalea sp.]